MKTERLISAIAATVAVIACSKETAQDFTPVNTQAPVAETGYFTADCGDPTKVTMDASDGYKLSWEADDKVAVYKVGGTELSQYTAKTAGATTVLEGEAVDTEAGYYAVYPLSAAAGFDGTSAITAKVAATQALSKDTLPENVMVAYTTGADAAFHFKNVGSLIQFTLSGNKVSRVAISAVDGEDVAGVVDIANPASPAYTVTSGFKTLDITPAGGAATFEAGTYYAAILPGTYAHGISVKVYNDEGKQASRKQNKAQAIARSGRLNIGTIDGWSFEMNRTITTADEFANFLSVAASDGDNTWTITDGIDMNGVELTGAASFAGTLDGGSFTVENLTVRGPLFGTLTGTVQDLTLGGGSKLIIPSTAAANGFIAGTNTGTIENVTVGGSANLEANSASPVASTYVDMYIGGIAGVNEGTIVSCTNNADIALTRNISKYTPLYLGGIVGKQNTTTVLDDCTNNGEVSVTAHVSASTYIGGIVGGTPAGESLDAVITSCPNHGTIGWKETTADGTSSQIQVKMGGVAGYFSGSITGSANDGAITFSYPKEAIAGNSVRNATIGGVAGTVLGALSGSGNSGEINIEGSFCYSTNAVLNNTFFGGVAGYAAGTVTSSGNSGNLTAVAMMNGTGTANHTGYVGGIAGYAADAVEESDNSGALDVTATFVVTHVGGIAGYSANRIKSCTNSNSISLDLVNTEATYSRSKQSYVGGISGYHNPGSDVADENTGNRILYCQNTAAGDITVSGGYYDDSTISYIGGIAGYATSGIVGKANTAAERTTSSGDITVNGSQQVRVGGIVGEIGGNRVAYVTFAGALSIPDVGAKSCVGGIAGIKTTTLAYSTLTGTVEVGFSGELNTTNNVRVGLIVGVANGNLTVQTVTIGAAAKVTTTNAYTGLVAGFLSNNKSITLNPLTVRPGVKVNSLTVSAIDDLAEDSVLVGRMGGSGASITRTNLTVG